MDPVLKYLIETYGIPFVGMCLSGWLLFRAIKFIFTVLDRMSQMQKEASTTQNTMDKGQLELSMAAMKQNEASQNRLAELQRAMIEEQQSNQKVMHALTQQITHVVLQFDTAVKHLQALTQRAQDSETRTQDWDNRLGLFVRTQAEQAKVIAAFMETINRHFNTILEKLTGKDTAI